MSRSLLSALAVAAVLSPALTADAAGQSAAFPLKTDRGVVGPRIDGERIVWLRPPDKEAQAVRPTSARVEHATFAGVRSRGARVELPPGQESSLTLSVAGGRVAVQRVLYACSIDCAHASTLLRDDVFLGPLDGPLDVVAGCAAAACDPCESQRRFLDVRLGEDALALRTSSSSCDAPRVTVRSLADGSERVFAAGRALDLRARLILLAADRALMVVDWRTGEELYRVPSVPLTTFGERLGDDGTLSFVREREGGPTQLMYATPAEPYDHPLPVQGYLDSTAPAGGAIGFADSSAPRVGIATNGGAVREVASGALAGVDFERGRLTWAARPCGTTFVAVWDQAAEPPVLSDQCALPGSVGRVARLRSILAPECHPDYCGRAFRLPIRCRPAPVQGCAGRATLRTRGGRVVGEGSFVVPAGERGLADIVPRGPGVPLRFRGRVLLRAAGSGRARVFPVRLIPG
jgi:hypothetical protein